MPENNAELLQMLPFLIIGAGIVISVIIEISTSKSVEILPWFSNILYLAAAIISVTSVSATDSLFGGMLRVGGHPAIFSFIFNVGAILITLNSIGYLKKYGTYFGEYYILLQSAVLGMMLMASAGDIFVIFLGLELMSICFYILAGLNRDKASSNEASLKYFLLGAFATGFIVYGIALIFGSAGTTSIDEIVNRFSYLTDNILFIAGFALFLIGFSFKIAAFPFHMWVPDVYQGSATTVTGFMSTTGKSAAFSVILIMMASILGGAAQNTFAPYFAAIALLSMLYGSIVAIAQKNIKRMLAYSSIAHAGYMSIGLAAGNMESLAGIIFYLAAYVFMNVGAFAVISMVEAEDDKFTDISAYAGLSSRSPVLAGFMALFMFALAGIPPMAGFFGKYYVFVAAIESGFTWLALLGVLSSVISVYFYLRIVVLMYFREADENSAVVTVNAAGYAAVILSGLLVIAFGLVPDTLMDLITSTF